MSGMANAESPVAAEAPQWDLCLYITNMTPRSVSAVTKLKKICEQRLAGRYRIEVVDLLKDPERAISDQIVAIPTVVRRLPKPIRKTIGDLSNAERFLEALELSEV
jgi:circadian clock protein KaiB